MHCDPSLNHTLLVFPQTAKKRISFTMSPVPANNRDIKKDEEEGDISAADAPQFAIDNSDSDSEAGEEDPDGYQGYQLLPQDPDGGNNEGDITAEPPPVAPTPSSAVDEIIMQSLDNQDMMNAVALQVYLLFNALWKDMKWVFKY